MSEATRLITICSDDEDSDEANFLGIANNLNKANNLDEANNLNEANFLDEATKRELHNLTANKDEFQFVQLAEPYQPLPIDFILTTLNLAFQNYLGIIVAFLLRQTTVTSKHKFNMLHEAASKNDERLLDLLLSLLTCPEVNDFARVLLLNYENPSCGKCYELLWERRGDDIEVNGKDVLGNCLIHYANCPDSEIVLDLLKRGATLANKTNYGAFGLVITDCAVLEEHFDSCIEDGHMVEYAPVVSFDYKSLLPSNTNVDNEMDMISYIAESNELRKLLQHPLLLSFLRIKYIHFLHVGSVKWKFELLFYFVLYFHITSNIFQFVHLILSLVVTFLICLEILEFAVCLSKYFSKLVNYIKIINYALCLYYYRFDVGFVNHNWHEPIEALIFTLTTILVYIGTCHTFRLNRLYDLRSSYRYINYLGVIIKNYLKVFLVYFTLILYFAFSFNIIFANNSKHNKSVKHQNITETMFNNPLTSLILWCGELNVIDIDFKNNTIGLYYFLIFVLCFSIPFMNMLIGLAVTDIQRINDEAKLSQLTSQVRYIADMESLLIYNDKWNFIQKTCSWILRKLYIFKTDAHKLTNIINGTKLDWGLNSATVHKNDKLNTVLISVRHETKLLLRSKKVKNSQKSAKKKNLADQTPDGDLLNDILQSIRRIEGNLLEVSQKIENSS